MVGGYSLYLLDVIEMQEWPNLWLHLVNDIAKHKCCHTYTHTYTYTYISIYRANMQSPQSRNTSRKRSNSTCSNNSSVLSQSSSTSNKRHCRMSSLPVEEVSSPPPPSSNRWSSIPVSLRDFHLSQNEQRRNSKSTLPCFTALQLLRTSSMSSAV